ncbi:fumarylacetoacetate hydrolase family protein [Pokkaliibacter sp. MBI-7]|uniref:fumarylacetoacetate hydrolase family protein n=1 Tax=Pokkaliibacter sp. MBI-7 TaxID=3040600 RepID=UPI00244D1D12|nr:fumarylacetoacetate hydrolase family protein [Pokkaliibacter sp. MBI-7]MDH2431795.1 fumarylacetoacetate hydrolase family protein [Pokkaliibacter sp. MBI-7]
MALTVIRFSHAGAEPAWGVLFGDKVAPLSTRFATTGELIERGMEEARALRVEDAVYKRAELSILSPVTTNQQFLCQGLNYRCHVRESGMDPAKLPFNTLFTKAPSSITAAYGGIIRPNHVRLLDYELELGVVVGRHINGPVRVDQGNLHQYAAALTIVNDISARDVQLPQAQFYKGKSYRTFAPVGPYLLFPTVEEWRRLGELHLRLLVNRDVRQDSYCREMIYRPEQTLTELSSIHDMAPGDLLATGTPAGCAAKAPSSKVLLWALKALMSERRKWAVFLKAQLRNPRYLQPGDEMTASIRTDDGLLDLGEQRHQILQGQERRQ